MSPEEVKIEVPDDWEYCPARLKRRKLRLLENVSVRLLKPANREKPLWLP